MHYKNSISQKSTVSFWKIGPLIKLLLWWERKTPGRRFFYSPSLPFPMQRTNAAKAGCKKIVQVFSCLPASPHQCFFVWGNEVVVIRMHFPQPKATMIRGGPWDGLQTRWRLAAVVVRFHLRGDIPFLEVKHFSKNAKKVECVFESVDILKAQFIKLQLIIQ